MDQDMGRRHGNGSYDRSVKSWKRRTSDLNVKVSIRKLSEVFGVEIPADERKSYPYWRR
jgi:hypothetical protein